MITIAAETRDAIDELMGETVRQGTVPGLVAAVTTAESTVFAEAYGRRAQGERAPMTLDTMFRIDSMTKAFTVVACLQAAERGLVGLDQDLGTVLPALAKPQVLDGFVDGQPRLRPATSPVTLRRLLTHTAGCAYDMWNAAIRDYTIHTGRAWVETFGTPDQPLPLASDPGTRWEYGVGMEWAGKVLEALYGEPLETVFRRSLFGPLGMSSTGYTLSPDMRRRLVGGHQRGADGSLTNHTDVLPDSPRHALGGGGTLSSAPDYLRFLRMILNGGRLDGATILGRDSIAELGREQIGDLPRIPMRTALPHLSNDFEALPGARTGWGLGFEINLDPLPGRRHAGSFCWAGLRNTYYWVDPDAGIAGLLLAQILPFGDPVVLELLRRFEALVYGAAP